MGRQGYEKVKRQFDMEHRAPARSLLKRALPIAQMDRLIFAALAPTISTLFHQLFYAAGRARNDTWMNTRWMGCRVMKSPLDMWVYQEIMHEKRPDIVIETGSAQGGSALFFANMMDLLSHGEVISVDIRHNPGFPKHARITYLTGSSTDEKLVQEVAQRIRGKTVMVVLDSDHSKSHVLNELEIYAKFVSKDQYLVVEDTNVNGHPVLRTFGPGPLEAVKVFLSQHNAFRIDRSKEKYLFTFNPSGYLLRVG